MTGRIRCADCGAARPAWIVECGKCAARRESEGS